MLGETQGTSAGGAEEAGKFLRVPGTNPFWPDDHDHQGNRFLELMAEHQLDVYLMNTGRVGGPDGDDGSEKVRIPHSSRDREGRSPRARSSGRRTRTSATRSPRACRASRTSDPPCCARASSTSRTGRTRRVREDRRDAQGRAREFLQKFPALTDEIVAAVR